MALLAGTIIALLAVALVLEPILRPVRQAAILRPDSDDDDITPEERRRDLALAALKEIEFDQATGKLSDTDYQRLYQRYAGEAVDAIRETEAGGPTARPPVRPKFCEECGTRLESSGKFCSECGAQVLAA